jgi:hypothetical protein
MRLRRYLVRLATVTALLGGAVACLAASSPAASAAPAGAAPASDGWVRFANLSPGAPAMGVYLYPFGNPAHPVMLRHSSYGEVSSYMPIGAGQYTVAMRPAGAPASSPPVVSANFMVSAGTNYTVASIGPAAGRRLEVLTDQMTAPRGKALVRILQASARHPQVRVSDGPGVFARPLAFGSATPYVAVLPGVHPVEVGAPDAGAAVTVTLPADSVHTLVVLDSAPGLEVDNLTDAAGSQVTPARGAATGLGGTALWGTGSAPWLGTLAAGLALILGGAAGLRRSRRAAAARR